MISRRAIVNAGLASAVVLGGETAARSSVSSPENFWSTAAPIIQAGPPMNFDRAYQILAEENLDGLILCSPTNIFHATGYVDRVARMHDTPTSFVIISKDPKRRPALVMNQFLYFYSYSDCGLNSPIDVFISQAQIEVKINCGQILLLYLRMQASVHYGVLSRLALVRIAAFWGAAICPPMPLNRSVALSRT